MYEIFLDNKHLYTPKIEEYHLIDATIDREVNKIHKLTFEISEMHPRYNEIHALKSIVQVKKNGQIIFNGRVLMTEDVDFANNKRVICENALGYLMDSVARPFSFAGTIRNLLTNLILQHNQQVELHKRFVLGDVTVTDPNDYIVRSSESPNETWKTLETKLLESLGGYLVYEYQDGQNVLHYLADSINYNTQKIQLGENLLDITRAYEIEGIATGIIPYGAKLEDSEERLTIKSVNDDKDYLLNEEAVEAYTIIMKSVVWDDVTIASNLKTKALDYLAENADGVVSIKVNAFDFSILDQSIDDYQLFEYVHVVSSKHQLNEHFLITQQHLDLLDPSLDRLQLNKQVVNVTDYLTTSKSDVVKLRETVQDVEKTTSAVIQLQKQELEQSIETIREENSELYVKISALNGLTLNHIQSITASTNLNHVTAPGFYAIRTNAISATILNKPINLNVAAIVEVIPVTANHFIQRFYFVQKQKISNFERVYESGAFGDWLTLHHETEWQNLTLSLDFEAYNTNSTIQYKQHRNIVSIRGLVLPTADIASNQDVVIASGIPQAARPLYPHAFICATNSKRTFICTVLPDGTVNGREIGVDVIDDFTTNDELHIQVQYTV